MISDTEDSDYSSFSIDMDDEIDENEEKLQLNNKPLMRKLSKEHLSNEMMEKAIQEFYNNFNNVYLLYNVLNMAFNRLSEAIQNSLYNTEEPCPLLIYLHHSKNPSTHPFCKNILCNEFLIDLINVNFIFWPWDCTYQSNADLFLWMLSTSLGEKYASKVSKIPLEQYPLFLSLTFEENSVVLNEVSQNLDEQLSIEMIYPELISIREAFVPSDQLNLHSANPIINQVRDHHVQLYSTCDEYKKVAENFNEKIFQISNIYRLVATESTEIVDPEMIKRNSQDSSVEETILYHGCSQSVGQEIIRRGFSDQMINEYARRFGIDFCFSTNPEFIWIDSLPDFSNENEGERTILICQAKIDKSSSRSFSGRRYFAYDDYFWDQTDSEDRFKFESIYPLYLVHFHVKDRFC